jgi:hypothetical protein
MNDPAIRVRLFIFTLPSPSHSRSKERDLRQEGGFERMKFIPVLKNGAFWHNFVKLGN